MLEHCISIFVRYELWMGKISGCEEMKEHYGVEEVVYMDQIAEWFKSRAPSKVYLQRGVNSDSGNEVAPAKFEGLEAYDVDTAALHAARKNAEEIRLLRYVNRISSDAHMAMMREAQPGIMEWGPRRRWRAVAGFSPTRPLQAQGPIRPSGPMEGARATVLATLQGHAGAPNDRKLEDGDMVLCDMGCEFFCYASDITNSFPAKPVRVLMRSRYANWCISALASRAVACNWCYLRTCLVDFAPDFCASSCGSLQFQADVDWQRSQDMLEVVVRIWTQINPDSQEYQQVQTLLLEAIELGRQSCEAAALTAQLLVMGFQQPAALEVQKLLLLPQGEKPAAHSSISWASNWFLSLPDPAILALTGWQAFFDALGASLAQAPSEPCDWLRKESRHSEALDLLRLAASMELQTEAPGRPRWQQAVAFRVLKDRLRSAFEILRMERQTLGHECLSTVAGIVAEVSSRVASKFRDVSWTSTLSRWPELPSPPRQELGQSLRAAVCVAGQPRAMSGELLEPMARQLFKSLCPVAAGTSAPLLLLFSLASQPHLGVEAGDAASLQSQLSRVLQSTSCPQLGPVPAVLQRVDVVDDASYEDVAEFVNAYSEEAWWHGEGHGRLKWARQLLGIDRCHTALQEEEEIVGQVDWVVFLRPDLLHVVPLPDLSHLWKGHVVVLPDGGQKLTPQAGYLEGLDRALILSRSVAEAFFVLPHQSLRNASFLKRHPTCLSCSGWRSAGVKLSPEKHLANVLWQWAEDRGSESELELTVDENWIQPLVLSETGCINFRPCADRSCLPAEPQQQHAPTHGPRLPRWARGLALRRTCWPLDAEFEAGAEAWVNAAPPDTVEAFLESPAAILVPHLPEPEN
ncbi:Pepd [Symbiodinium sp. KB8]|nr:Pepd [Symbiodinium sp. KB8]